MKRATEFEQSWRGVWARIGTMAEGGELKLLDALTNPMKKFGDWLDTNSGQINDAISKMATAVGSLTTAWVEDLNKVKWPDVATHIDEAAKSIAHFADELARSLPLLQAFLGALLGAKIGGLFGPLGALLGAGAGASTPGMIEQEMDPNAPHAVDTGVGGWLKGAWGGVKRFFGGGGGTPGAGEKVVGHWWTPERMKYAADRLMKEAGLSEAGAAGLVARWAAVEFPGGPGSVNPLSGAVGIAQGLGDRKAGYMGSFEEQVSNAVRELNGPEAKAARVLRNALTPEQGAIGGSMFERAEGYNPSTGTDAFTGATPVAKTLEAIRNAADKVASQPAAAPKMSPAGGPWVKSGGKEYGTDQNGMIVESVSRPVGVPSYNGTPAGNGAPLAWDSGSLGPVQPELAHWPVVIWQLAEKRVVHRQQQHHRECTRSPVCGCDGRAALGPKRKRYLAKFAGRTAMICRNDSPHCSHPSRGHHRSFSTRPAAGACKRA